MIDDKLNHKLNNHNYKIYKMIIKFIHLIFMKASYFALIIVLLIAVLTSIFSKSLILILLLPFDLLIFYIYITSFCGVVSLIYCLLIYYVLRFSQINTQLRLFCKIKKISVQTINRTIDEHNQLSLEIHRLSLTLSKTIGWLFIITAIVIDLLIYMLIYTKSRFYQLLFLLIFIGCFIFVVILDYLFIKVSISAHQSYNLMYSIIQRQILPYRIRFKVKLNKMH